LSFWQIVLPFIVAVLAVAPFYHLDSDERAQVYIFYLTNYATKADISPQQILVKAVNKEIPDISVEDRIYHEEAGPGPL
jgi:hypothetical protein